MAEDKYLFISKGPSVLYGESARFALERENDSSFYVPGQGIPRVSRSRWQLAQDAEASHWFGDGKKPSFIGDDRNLEHFRRFNQYRAIQNLSFRRALEIGSGPFTNMRLVSAVVGVEDVTLVDPGLENYLTHPGCYYNREALAKVWPSKFFSRVWPILPRRLKDAYLSNPSRTTKVRALHSTEAERFDGHRQFDLVMMANVLEHCIDSEKVLDSVFSSVAPGGVVILSEKTHLDESVRYGLRRFYDVAHPIRVTKTAIEDRLADFEILFYASVKDPASSYLPGTEESYWIARAPKDSSEL